ncbi:MAG: serine/threonine protein kinase [Oscillospiraceae bacterium]|nr:serine/threonine protein kinase [Oscillospiraceae bacterium]
MTEADQYALSCYRELAILNEAHRVWLVQHITSKILFVKKILTVYNAEVYRLLQAHPVAGIPEIFEVIEDAGELTVIEEYIQGRTLQDILNEGGLFTAAEAAGIVRQLCGILQELHSFSPAIIHRDIKPSNIILTPDGSIRLLDLNAAKQVSHERSEDTVLMGTIGYAAPEQYGFGASDVRADLYSCGVLLNELITGSMPNEKLADGSVGEIIRRCTRMDPADRYSSAGQLLHDLSAKKLYKKLSKESRPKKKKAPLLLLTVIFGIALILLLYAGKKYSEKPPEDPLPSASASIIPEPAADLDSATETPVLVLPAWDDLSSLTAVGGTVLFGRYEQDNIPENSAEPVEWIVLDVQEEKALVLSRYALDCQVFNPTRHERVSWESCSLRAWLNSSFLQNAFTEEELARIASVTVPADYNPKYISDPGADTEDRIFLLSCEEALRYFEHAEDRICTPTPYAVSQGSRTGQNGGCWWGLRSPGYNAYVEAGVWSDGYPDYIGHFADDLHNAVRPAMWITLSS